MNDQGRKGAAVALLLLASAAAGAGLWLKGRQGTPATAELERSAGRARARNQQALAAVARTLETRVAEASRIPQLLGALESGDAKTLQDFLDDEDSWAEVRRSYPLGAVISENRVLGRWGAAVDLGGLPLIEGARGRGPSSGLVAAEDRTFLAATALVGDTARLGARQPVLLLGEGADSRLLQRIVDATGDALGLSNGRRLLDSAGPSDLRQALPELIGFESAGVRVLSGGLDRGSGSRRSRGIWGTAIPSGSGRWIWIAFAGAAAPSGLPPAVRVLWGLALLLGLGGVALAVSGSRGRSRRRESPSRADESVTIHRQPTQKGMEPPAQDRPARRPDTPVSGSSPTPAVAAAVLPRRTPPYEMGRYRLLRQLGEGGMAEVYIAEAHGAEGFKRHFVVKRLHPHLATRKEVVTQFIDEARLQARLLHSNIVPVFDFGRAGDEYFLALEYVHGRDLEKLTQRHLHVLGRALPLSIVAFVIAEVLEALAYAHARTSTGGEPLGIVHRDVSPANVLVSFLGEVKLSDFGIVKAAGRVSKTDERVIKGNVNFMSPEQARGESVDSRSDLFSAGVVMFFCLTGRTLYSGDTTINQLMRAAVGPVTEQFEQLRDLPPEAGAILNKALALDPARRYQGAAEFARALRPLATSGKTDLAQLMQAFYADEMKTDF
jgi:hypothetical protein